MRRPTLKASPAMLRRAMVMQAPLGVRHVPILARKPKQNSRQLELADAKPAERQDDSTTNQ